MNYLPLVLLFLFIGCVQNPETSLPPPIVDGWMTEYADLGIAPIALSDDVDLYIYQDAHYVWISYTVPGDSFGALDLVVDTDDLSEPVNLHVSAQLGEWPANQPELAPKVATSPDWWNHKDWVSNVVWMNGMLRDTDPPEIQFKNGTGRELQLSKSRFGAGTWKLAFDIRMITNSEGESYNITYPEDGSQYEIEVY
ncbi:MAG: hypothetical protein KTR13_07695 [Saprospiraceae bacterium]|nr:hypothetical protein [Saprospiraceae bacterium]